MQNKQGEGKLTTPVFGSVTSLYTHISNEYPLSLARQSLTFDVLLLGDCLIVIFNSAWRTLNFQSRGPYRITILVTLSSIWNKVQLIINSKQRQNYTLKTSLLMMN